MKSTIETATENVPRTIALIFHPRDRGSVVHFYHPYKDKRGATSNPWTASRLSTLYANRPFRTKDGQFPSAIEIDSTSPHWQLELSHELGHILTAKYLDFRRYPEDETASFRVEVLAWRVARSFLPSFLFNENYALKCIYTYIPGSWSIGKKVKFLQSFKIRELNKGVKL